MNKNKKKYRERYKKPEVLTAVCFLLPAVFMWIYWFFIPAVKSMRLSFYDYSFITPERTRFIGLDNFIRLFQDKDFIKALEHTFLMAAVVVVLIAVIAFLIAVLLDGNIKGKTFFRTTYYMPYVISSVAVSIFFMYFLSRTGLGPGCLRCLVLITPPGLRVRNTHCFWLLLFTYGSKLAFT